MIRHKNRIDMAAAMALALIVLWIVAMLVSTTLPQGWITKPTGVPAEADYIGIYTAGQLAKSGEAPAVYDLKRHEAAQRQLEDNPKASFYPWPYPPTFLLVATVLALLPYYASMLTWVLATFALFAAAIARISASRRDMLLMLATPAPWINLYVGQNGALTAALLGFGLVLLETQPIVAGITIGLLSFKPRLGLLIPLALLAGGYYRSFASAAATAVAMAIISIAAFGTAPWLALSHQLAYVTTIIQTAHETEKIVTLFGFARAMGFSSHSALLIQFCLTAALAILIVWVWQRRDVSFDMKAATLTAAVPLATPYLFVYDLVMLTLAQAFILRALSARTVTRLDAYPLLIANALIIVFNQLPPMPIAFFASVIVMAVTLRHVWREIASSARDVSAAEKLTARCLATALPSGKT